MNISFVIPVLNGDKYIQQCLESIFSEITEVDEVIVIDNGSTDRTVSIVESFENVELLIQPDITVAAMRNRGEALSRNMLLAFIDADCVLCEGWRRQVIDVFANGSVHAAGSLYDIPDNACWIEKAWFSQKVTEKAQAKYINSGNLVVWRAVFNALNGFDETLVSDEDCDFGERLNKAGYFMLEDPNIRVVHLGNPKSVKEFYVKETWHATSALAGQTLNSLDRPTMMSIFFGISVLFSFVFIVAAVFVGANLLWLVLSVLFVPLVTAIYRAHQFKRYRYIPELTLLWWIFYLVRIKIIVNHLLAIRVINA